MSKQGFGKSIKLSGKDRTRSKAITCGSNGSKHSSTTTTSSSEYQEPRAISDHAENVLSGMEAMWRQEHMVDVVINVGGARLRAHRNILASCTDYFDEDFVPAHDDSHRCQIEVDIDNMSQETMGNLLESIYTGKILINEDNVRDILAGASELRLYAIQEACGEFLTDRLCASNCLRMIAIAFAYNLQYLADSALQMAARHFMEISEGFDYQQLQIIQLLPLLQRDDILVTSELDIFKRALSWIDADKVNRMRYAGDVMQTIRLPLLPPSDVVDQIEAVDYLMEIPECQKLVKEALYYHCLPSRQSILQSPRTNPRSRWKREVVIAIGGGPRLKTEPVADDISYYDEKDDEWHPLTKLKEPRHHHAVAVLGGFVYVAGGESRNDQSSPVSTAHRYDPRTDTWLQIASMKRARESFQLGVLNGMLYAVGGRVDQSKSLADVERYNPAIDGWETVAPLSGPRRSVAVTAHCGKLYAMGGSGYKRISSKVERYNPLSDHWENRRALPIPRFFAMLVSLGNRLMLFGGATLDESGDVVCAKTVECYLTTTDTWSTLAPMSVPRAEAGFAVLGNKIYVIGGYCWDKNKRLSSVECYDVDRDRWKSVKSLNKEYTGVAACTLMVYNLPATSTPDLEKEYNYVCTKGESVGTDVSCDKTQIEADDEQPSTESVAEKHDQGKGEPRRVHSSVQ